MPAARVFYLLALTTLIGIAGVGAPSLAWTALALDGLILLAFLYDHHRISTVRLTASREWPQALVQGAEAELGILLSLQVPDGLGPQEFQVRLRETLHPHLADQPCREDLLLVPASTQRWIVRFTPKRRGDPLAGPLMARLLGPWRLAWRQQTVLDAETRRVYPQVRWQGKVGQLLLLADRRALGQNPQSLVGLGSEPYALREYLPGDPPHKIHWKATARHGRLVTREDSWERGARLLILLDCGRSMSTKEGERSKLDHALAAALALTRVALGRGDRVTLVAFSDRIERSLRLRTGRRSLATAYGRLYDLEARLTEPAFDLATRTVNQLETRRCTAVLLTSVVDLASAEMLRRSVLQLERRHRPILINLLDPELLSLAYDEPQTAEDAFAKAAALEILLGNRRLATRLRHAGVRVVNTAADHLTLETLEAYLALFRQRAA